jgi:hypothetical protein
MQFKITSDKKVEPLLKITFDALAPGTYNTATHKLTVANEADKSLAFIYLRQEIDGLVVTDMHSTEKAVLIKAETFSVAAI